MKKIIKNIFNLLRSLIYKPRGENDFFLLIPSAVDPEFTNKIVDIKNRLKYFDSKINIITVSKLKLSQYFNYDLIGLVDHNTQKGKFMSMKKIKYNEVYDLDFENNYLDGWEYHRLLTCLYREEVLEGVESGKKAIGRLKLALQSKFSKAYILGTGPSLEKAIEVDWADGIRIVSNTIVKDFELWEHIRPHFIVAGDAIYHFGFSNFAKKFRRDLKERLEESQDTFFIIPSSFYAFCLIEFVAFKDRIIPVPIGDNDNVHLGLTNRYLLPNVGNVLPLLLLPVACTFSKDVFLWGFDGRSPDAKGFWKNSDKHFYNDDVEQLKELHPAFFATLIPKGKQDQYVKNVHGDALDNALIRAEGNGFRFNMMHFSYTEILKKRSVTE